MTASALSPHSFESPIRLQHTSSLFNPCTAFQLPPVATCCWDWGAVVIWVASIVISKFVS